MTTMDVHVLMGAGARGRQTTLHVHTPVGEGYSTEQERALSQRKSINCFPRFNFRLLHFIAVISHLSYFLHQSKVWREEL